MRSKSSKPGPSATGANATTTANRKASRRVNHQVDASGMRKARIGVGAKRKKAFVL